MSTAIPDKQFFKIGEVAEIVGVKTHVVRYWESEFTSVRPMKTRGAHRMYRRCDVETLCLIRRLLYEEGYTIPGAKKRVRELNGDRSAEGPVDGRASREVMLRAELIQVRSELQALLDELSVRPERKREAPDDAAPRATVTAVVPRTVLMQRRPR
jgi:DNA-binding transcriptional MerR regulator